MNPHRVLVVGLPRGGTTWIGKALARCAGAVYVHEPDGVHDAFAYRAIVRDGLEHHPALLPGATAPEYTRLWAGVFEGGAPAQSIRARIAARTLTSVPAWRRARARRRDEYPWSLRVTLACAQPRVADSRATAVVAKSVNAALAIEWIHAQFRPQVLVVQRDIRNVVASWLAIGFGAPSAEFYSAIKQVARARWAIELDDITDPFDSRVALIAVLCRALDDAISAHPEWAVVSHEAACTNPTSIISAGAESVGLRWTDAANAFVLESNRPGEGYSTNRMTAELPESWAKRLSASEARRIDEVLDRFGGRRELPR